MSPITKTNISISSNVNLDIQLAPAFHTYTGTVTDQNGNPVVGLSVEWNNNYNDHTFTDSTGKFSFSEPANKF